MGGATTRQGNQANTNKSSVAAFYQRERRSALKQKLGHNKDRIQTFKQHVKDILDEIEIYHKHVPREDWKDMDQLASLLEMRRQHLDDLWATRRRLESEIKEIRKEVLRQLFCKLCSWIKLKNIGRVRMMPFLRSVQGQDEASSGWVTRLGLRVVKK
ncbi:hypothetical protein FPOAC1_005409 [Fusarium poae]|uniref:hypothetical protein n=1 Tax=Fusarium poae TaxID=36050 RepID=UPI001CE75C41|nr:hypothetical protein FPOAC1_005409 [Fusarium poae]KAG8672148.1 hypothetical protein FPOAC1_005409 [Fusarium poae]